MEYIVFEVKIFHNFAVLNSGGQEAYSEVEEPKNASECSSLIRRCTKF